MLQRATGSPLTRPLALLNRSSALPHPLRFSLSSPLAPHLHSSPLLPPYTHAVFSSLSSVNPSPSPSSSSPSSSFSSLSRSSAYPLLNFDDVTLSFQSKTDAELLRALFVYRLCTIRPIVRHADRLLHWSNSLLGHGLTKALLKPTFFGQFVAGETAEEVIPVVERMERSGVGAILDYAAEADVSGDQGGAGHAISARSAAQLADAQHEANVALFASSIEAAGQRKDGFAAIKLTAIGSPDLLIAISDYVVAVKRLYHALLIGGKVDERELPHLAPDAAVTHKQFVAGLRTNGMSITEEEAEQLFNAIATAPPPPLQSSASSSPSSSFAASSPAPTPSRPSLSFIRFSDYFSPLTGHTLPILPTPSSSALSDFAALTRRAESLASLAAQRHVRLLVDAEQTYLQPAIDCAVLNMQRLANTSFPHVYNTYQCYLRDTFSRVQMDAKRAQEEGWTMAAKTVRGAYMWQERKRAQDKGYADPIQPSFAATTSNYHSVVDFFLHRVPHSTHLVVAGHNEGTVKWVCGRMEELGMQREAEGVFFGQLLGMCDHVSYSLAQSGYRVVKVTPYGPLDEVMPYLIRRAQENADVLDRATKERQLVWNELMRRKVPSISSRTGLQETPKAGVTGESAHV